MIVIGVTGHISGGKSTVSGIFKKNGAQLIDADRIAKDVLKESRVRSAIKARFGTKVFAGKAVDRKALASVVFNDRKSLKDLCGIVHPVVIEDIEDIIEHSSKDVVVVDAPLLIESGLHKKMDYVVCVLAPERLRLKRAARKGMKESDLLARQAAQLTGKEKAAKADHVIRNAGPLSELRKNAGRVWDKIINKRRK
jgi:dephospho-CoA kinase